MAVDPAVRENRTAGDRHRRKARSRTAGSTAISWYSSGYAQLAAGGFVGGMTDGHGQGIGCVLRSDGLGETQERLHHQLHLALFGPPIPHHLDFDPPPSRRAERSRTK